MEVKEQAERKIARLNTRIQQLESQGHRLAADNAHLTERLAEAQGAVAQAAAAVDAAGGAAASGGADLAAARGAAAEAEGRCATLEAELRRSKRREEKLQVRERGAPEGEATSPRPPRRATCACRPHA